MILVQQNGDVELVTPDGNITVERGPVASFIRRFAEHVEFSEDVEDAVTLLEVFGSHVIDGKPASDYDMIRIAAACVTVTDFLRTPMYPNDEI